MDHPTETDSFNPLYSRREKIERELKIAREKESSTSRISNSILITVHWRDGLLNLDKSWLHFIKLIE